MESLDTKTKQTVPPSQPPSPYIETEPKYDYDHVTSNEYHKPLTPDLVKGWWAIYTCVIYAYGNWILAIKTHIWTF